MRALLLSILFLSLLAQTALAAFTANANFDFYPQYIPKNSTPFAFKVCYSGLDSSANYDLKATLGSSDGSSQASKTWNGASWVASNNYGPTIQTNSSGDFCLLIYLQTNPSASAYSSLVENSATAYITAKLRKSAQTSNTSGVSSMQVKLLDLCDDENCYGSGGTGGGWLEGFYPNVSAGAFVKIKNNSDTLSAYTTEDNSVSENYLSSAGYFKLATPAGNFTLEISNSSGILKTENISVLQNDTTYSGSILYFLISSNIETENLGESYKAAANSTYKIFSVENLEYSKILGQNLSQPTELNFSWNVTNASAPSQIFSSGSILQNFTEEVDSGDWTPAENILYTACGTINYAKADGISVYNIAPRWASPEVGDYGNTYCINISVGINKISESCAVLAGIETEQDSFEKGDSIPFWIKLNSTASHDSALKWWIEDFSGKTIAQKYFSTPANKSNFLIDKSWNGKKTGDFTIKASFLDAGCAGAQESISEKQISILDKDNLLVSAKVDEVAYSFSHTANITVQLTNGFTTEKTGTLSVLAKRRLSIFGYNDSIASEAITIPANSVVVKNYSWQIPANAISGEYKIKASFAYEKTKNSYPQFSVSGLRDLGEPAIEILSAPQAKFGEFAFVFAKYSANNYNLPLKFLSYLYSPWLSTDLSGEVLKSSLENSSVAANINTSRNNSYYLLLPIILKNNCDAKFSDGSYSAKVRAYFSSPLLDRNFNISIAGANNARCTTVSEKTLEKIREVGGVKKITRKISEELPKKLEIELKSLAAEIIEGNLDFSVYAKNLGNETLIADVYSFIERDGEVVSLSKISTRKIVYGIAETFAVRTEIPWGAFGNYTLHVRVSDGERTYEILKEIEIQKESTTKMENSVSKEGPTGALLFGASKFLTDFVNAILKFFSGFFGG